MPVLANIEERVTAGEEEKKQKWQTFFLETCLKSPRELGLSCIFPKNIRFAKSTTLLSSLPSLLNSTDYLRSIQADSLDIWTEVCVTKRALYNARWTVQTIGGTI